jgi:hypothetical protein
MSASIMQPTYLPWAGYFNLMSRVSAFVFLDDVQFAKPSWQMRNRILHRGAPFFLSVPTEGSRNQILSEVRLAGDEFRSTHQKTLEHAYQKHPFGAEVLEAVSPLLADKTLDRLVDLHITIIVALAQLLGFAPRILRSSELGVQGKRSVHLLEILADIGETAYLSPEGSRGYITLEEAFANSNVSVEYQHFEAVPYPQKGTTEFVSHLSILDVAANLGFEGARRYVLEHVAQPIAGVTRDDPPFALPSPWR